MYEFNFTHNDTDYREFYKFNIKANRSLAIAGMLIGIIILFALLADAGGSRIMFVIFIALTALMSIISIRTQINTMVSRYKKNGKSVFGNTRMKFHEEYMYCFTEVTESKIKYSITDKISESKYGVYVYVLSSEVYIIPLSAFESEIQKNEFIEFMRRKINAPIKN